MSCTGLVNGICIHGFPATLACSNPYDIYKKYVVRIPRCVDEKWTARWLPDGKPSEQAIAAARKSAEMAS